MAETHNHAHHHHYHPLRGNALFWALCITLAFALLEAVGGWLAGSLALLGDAGHMVSDATALGVAAFAAWLARQPPSARHSYGLGRAEVIAALINGITMIVIVASIVIAAIERLQTPQPVSGATVVFIAALGLVVNVGLAVILSRGEQTLNTRGALLHVMGDLLGSIAALLAGAVIIFTGWTPIDPILSIFICILILFSALHLLRDGLHVIMEGVPAHLDLSEVGTAMARADDVCSVHDLHIWTLSSGHIALSAHVVIDDITAWRSVLTTLNRLLQERFGISHTTIQPECDTHIIRRMPKP